MAQSSAFALSDPTMTPGAVDPGVTLDQICNGTTRTRRPASTKLCDAAFAAACPEADLFRSLPSALWPSAP